MNKLYRWITSFLSTKCTKHKWKVKSVLMDGFDVIMEYECRRCGIHRKEVV